jgi:hypothetical protein
VGSATFTKITNETNRKGGKKEAKNNGNNTMNKNKKEWTVLKPRDRNTSKLQEIITKSMSTNIGTRTIYPNRKIKIQNTDLANAKTTRKFLKTEWHVRPINQTPLK